MPETAFLTADAKRCDELQPAPITAAHVISGQPDARSVQLTGSDDGRLTTHLWDCSAGRFHWYFGVDEIVHIVEGEVDVTDDAGVTRTLAVGDVAHFAVGSHTIWDVPEYVRKIAVLRAPAPAPLPVRAARRLRRVLRPAR